MIDQIDSSHKNNQSEINEESFLIKSELETPEERRYKIDVEKIQN
jgi:hypothetical protein